MANPSLQIGNDNWAIKEDNLLGYSTAGTRFVPQPITMTRATLGTRVNPSGLVEDVALLGSEEVTNGDFATDSDWSKGTGWTISGGSASHTGGASYLSQDVLQVDTLYKVNISVTEVSGGGFVQIYMGNSPASVLISQIGDYTYYFTSQSSVLLGLALRSLGDVTIDNVSVKEATIDNLPRVDYTDGTSSLLAEPQRTNLLTYSEDFSQSYWSKQSGVTPTYNTTETLSPDGTYNATKFIGNGSSGVLKSNINITGVVTRSVYLKSVTGTVNVVLKDPNLTITSKSLTVTTEWQRFDLTEDNTTSLQGIWIDDIPVSGIYMWGAQLEESYATSYIPTSGSTVTRNQETYEKTGISDKINSEEGVLFVEMAALSDDLTYRILSLSDGTTNERVYIQYTNASNTVAVVVKNGGSTQANMVYVLSDETQFSKIAIKWKVNDFAMWVDGVEVGTDTSGSVPLGLNRLAFDNASATNFFGKVKQLQVFKTALSDSELATLTT